MNPPCWQRPGRPDDSHDRIRTFHAGVRGDQAFAAAQERCWRTYHEMLAPFPFTQRLPRLLAPWLRVSRESGCAQGQLLTLLNGAAVRRL